MQDRLGEQSAVVCMLLKRRPFAASLSRLGVRIGDPKQPSCPYPVSSRTRKSTLGDPGLARSGCGHAGDDSPTVRPITPGNAIPGSYSLIAIAVLLAVAAKCVGHAAHAIAAFPPSTSRAGALLTGGHAETATRPTPLAGVMGSSGYRFSEVHGP